MTRATTLTVVRNAPSPPDAITPAIAPTAGHRSDVRANLSFHIYGDLAAVEREWRRFEHADCTAFQTFDWLAVATAYRYARRRCDRRLASAFRRRRHRLHPAVLRRAGACGTAAVLARPGTVRLQRAAAGARLLAAHPARNGSARCGKSCRRNATRSAASATTGSNLRRCRKTSALRSIRSRICA